LHRLATARRRIVTTLLMTLSVLSLVVTLLVTAPTAPTSALVPATEQVLRDSSAIAVDPAEPDWRQRPSVVAADAVAPAVATAPPALGAQLVTLMPLTADVWGATERYFAISGDSPDGLLASGKANIPADPTGAERHAMAYAGPVLWQHEPTYVIDASTGDCTMTGVTSTVAYQASLPQWTSPATVSPQLLAWWQVVLAHIRVHEGQHIHIFTDFVNALPGRVAGQPCSAWGSIVDQWSADIVSAQAAFDASEAGWVYPRYPGG
jgi:predicted secreted Zn-dependent protease